MQSQLNDLLKLISMSPKGVARIRMLEEAVRLADASNDWRLELDLRETLIEDDCFYGDFMKAILAFPRFNELFEQHIEKLKPYEINNFLWKYKYFIDGGKDYYQIPLDKLMNVLENFKQKCIELGYSLRTYYQYQLKYSMYHNNFEDAKHFYQLFQKSERDDLSDCLACECDFEVEYKLFIGEYETANKMAQPLFNGQRSCAEVPHTTYPKFLMVYLLHHQFEDAQNIKEKSYRLIYKKRALLEHLEPHILFYAHTNPKEGIKVFTNHLEWATSSKNGFKNFKFFLASWILWERVKEENEKKMSYTLKLPDNSLIYNETGKYQIDDLIAICKKQTLDLALKFDKRDQSTNKMEYIEEIKLSFKKEYVV